MRVAMVGCGAITAAHLDGLASGPRDRVEIVAAVDPDPERAAALARRVADLDLCSEKVARFTTYRDAAERGDFDAVIAAVPHDRHEQVAVDVLASGRHLLLEKPLAPTVAAADRILEVAAGSSRVFLVGETAQFWPEVITAGSLLDDGAIGEPITAIARVWTPALPEYYGPQAWRFDAAVAGGGIALDTGSHWIRPLRMWFGEIREIVGVTARPHPSMEAESLARALCRHDEIVSSVDLLLTDAPQPVSPLFRITGSTGEITIEMDGTTRLFDRQAPRGRQIGEAGGYFAGFAGQWSDFAAAVLDGAAPAAPADAALGELRCAHALYRSDVTRRFEPVWES